MGAHLRDGSAKVSDYSSDAAEERRDTMMRIGPKDGSIRRVAERARLRKRRLPILACSLLLVTSAGSGIVAFAQAPVGNIAGTVSDPSGATIPGATVTAISQAEGVRRSATTADQGYFLISTLQPGAYKVTIEAAGFVPVEFASVVVEVGQTARLDVKLRVAGSAERVIVEGGAAAVETTQSTVGGVVRARQIEELPLNGRNYLELAKLEPGIEIQDGKAFDPTKTRYTGISIGGRNGREARITLDGIDAVDEHVGTTTLNLTQESISEFQLSTSTSDPSTGLSATGAVNIITKSGTNTWHAGAFIFGRASAFAARPGLALNTPDFNREQFGGDIGGPLRSDKVFLFGNVERTREESSASISTRYFPNLTSFPSPYRETSNNLRIDWNLPHQYQTFFRWSRDENSNFGGFGGVVLPSSGNINANVTDQYVIGLDKAVSSNLVNSFRVGYTDFKNHVLPPPADAAALFVPGTQGFRILTGDNGLTSGPDINTPQQTFERFWQFRDDLTRTLHKHTLRFGGDVVRRRVTVLNFVAGFPSLLTGQPSSFDPASILNTSITTITIGNKKGLRIPGTPDNAHHNTRISLYADDSWRMTTNFTLHYGLRYEVDTHPLNNDLDKPSIISPLLPAGTAPTPINKKNFSPSLGFAWDPTGSHKTSIRGGFGLYYGMRISNLVTNERASIAPFNSGNDTIVVSGPGVVNFTNGSFDFTPAIAITGTVQTALPIITAGQAVYISAPAATVSTLAITHTGTVISNDFQTPYSQQFNLGVQREVPFKSILDVNFIYSRTVHEIMRDVDAGNILPGNGPKRILGDGTPADKQITLITSNGFSRYRALTVRWDRQFSNRLQFTASYALSRLETTSGDGLGLGAGTLVNRNPQANFGIGPLDRTHRFTLNAIYELPYAFRFSTITTAYSGLPQSITVGTSDLAGDGVIGSLLPGTRRGALNREVNTPAKLNALIRAYNLSKGGTPLPRSGRAPFLPEVPDDTKFGNSFVSTDLQLSKVFSFKERYKVELTAQVFNVFNVSNLVGPAGLPTSPFNGTLTTFPSLTTSGIPGQGFTLGSDGTLRDAMGTRVVTGGTFAGVVGGQPTTVPIRTTFASFGATRPALATGTGLPRAAQFGARFKF